MNNLPAPATGMHPDRAQSLRETGLEQLLSAGSTLGGRLSPAQGVTGVCGKGTGVQGLALALLGLEKGLLPVLGLMMLLILS